MVTEDYVSFEVAKLLKEKGFDGAVHSHYNQEGGIIMGGNPITKNCIERPTLQMAMKWLRKEHKLEIYPFHHKGYPKDKWGYNIKKEMPLSVIDKFQMLAIFDSNEESCDAAIKHCLENLI